MDISHSSLKCLCCESQDEDNYYYSTDDDGDFSSYGNFSVKFRKVLSFLSLVYRSSKGQLQNLLLKLLWRKKGGDSTVTLLDPSPISTDEITPTVEEEGEEKEEELQYRDDDAIEVLCCNEKAEENCSAPITVGTDHVIISVPEEEMVGSTICLDEISPEISVPCFEQSINVPCLEQSINVPCLEQSIDIKVSGLGTILDDEEETFIKDVVVKVDEGVKWIKHYCSIHKVLLVGEGDFSFSASLAMAFSYASNMIATSLDSRDFLNTHYKKAPSNIAHHPLLGHLKFDRIIFNFPFAGFFKNLSRQSQLKRHRRLVSLFLKNAKEMLSEDGEIHVSHKTNGFHGEWIIETIASSHRLKLIEAVRFDHLDYPGYNTKCGFGGDDNFNCHPSKTFKFGLRNS